MGKYGPEQLGWDVKMGQDCRGRPKQLERVDQGSLGEVQDTVEEWITGVGSAGPSQLGRGMTRALERGGPRH